MKRCYSVIGAAAAVLFAGQAMAEMSPADKTFATKAAAGGLAEVELGKIAAQNGASPTVRQFGERMVADHSQANQALMQIARQQGLTLPSAPGSDEQDTARRLSGLKGPDFDRAYTRDMISDHKEDISDFEREAAQGRDPALKAFAEKYLPVLREHLQMAQAAAKPM